VSTEYDNLDDGTAPVGETGTPLVGPSFMPKVWGLLLLVAIVLTLSAAIMNPSSRERPAPDEPWTPSSGPCEGLSPLECKWN
jgi:hypothetical protein